MMRVHWKIGLNEGYGDLLKNALAREVVKHGNKEYGDDTHWAIEATGKDPGAMRNRKGGN